MYSSNFVGCRVVGSHEPISLAGSITEPLQWYEGERVATVLWDDGTETIEYMSKLDIIRSSVISSLDL